MDYDIRYVHQTNHQKHATTKGAMMLWIQWFFGFITHLMLIKYVIVYWRLYFSAVYHKVIYILGDMGKPVCCVYLVLGLGILKVFNFLLVHLLDYARKAVNIMMKSLGFIVQAIYLSFWMLHLRIMCCWRHMASCSHLSENIVWRYSLYLAFKESQDNLFIWMNYCGLVIIMNNK